MANAKPSRPSGKGANPDTEKKSAKAEQLVRNEHGVLCKQREVHTPSGPVVVQVAVYESDYVDDLDE